MSKLFFLAIAGALGTVARVAIVEATLRIGAPFPWGTLLVNVLGSFAFGAVYAATDQSALAGSVRLYALAGFMGAFTTFSSMLFDVSSLAGAGRSGPAALDLVLHNALGLPALGAGLPAGRLL